MVKKRRNIAIDEEDYVWFKTDARTLFLRDNPHFEGVYLSDSFIFKRMRRNYE